MLEQELTAEQASASAGNQPSDEELEARWKAGSAPAFAMLFERYHTRIFAFTLRLTRDRHLAEDLAQRAFLNLYKKPPPGTGRASFKSLLFTVARNESLNEIKRRGRRKEASLEAVGEGRARAPGESPGEQVDQQEQQAKLSAALSELPDEEREVVLLREAEGLTFREICEVTGLSRDAVRWRLAKGMERLRQRMRGGDA